MSDDSDNSNKSKNRCKRPLKAASSTDSSDSGTPLVVSKRSRKQLAVESESEANTSKSSDNSPLALRLNRRRRVPIVESDEGSSSSEDEEIIAIRRPAFKRGALKILSDYESENSSNNDDGFNSESSGSLSEGEGSQNQHEAGKKKLKEEASGFSSDSDGQSERCPICLIKFVSQEVGTPESCDHYFCAVCILEWSKNVNTCPVDRQPYSLILIREHLEGKVIRQIPVNEPSHNQEVQQDATFCEVCGLGDREDRMLLCDGCDHGYHMECLDPPMEYVPIEEWFCPDCAPQYRRIRNHGRSSRHQRDEPEEEEEEEEGGGDFVSLHRTFRLVPRTRQAERVRSNLRRNNANNEPQQAEADQGHYKPSMSSGIESAGERVPVRSVARAAPRIARRTKKKGKTRQSAIRIKRIYTDDGVIEVILKRKGKWGKKKGRKKSRLPKVPRSVKGRLAAKLGMCAQKISRQTIPETKNRQDLSSAPIGHQRHQAAIPTLDLFGRRDQLDYFSGSEPEDDVGSMEGGVGVLSRVRVAHPSDRHISRKKAANILSLRSARKQVNIEKLALPAGPNLLDSILDSQALWHSKKTEIKSNSDGSLQVIPKGKVLKESKKVDVRKTTAPVIESPLFPGEQGNSGTFKSDNSNRGGSTQGGSSSYSDRSSEDTSYQYSGSASNGPSRSEGSTGGGPSPLRGMAPVRFRMNIPPRRPNIHSYPTDNIPPPPPLRLRSPSVEMALPTTNSPEASPSREEEDVDIYSDIEQESSVANESEEKTFGALEPPPEPPFLMTMEPPPEPPALLMNLNDDASDDEPSGLVIDDPPPNDVYDPCAMNSDESSTGDAHLSKPPALPKALKDPELVANYSSDSCPATEKGSYNPELPTYSSTPIIGPLPRPASHNSSDSEDNDEDCPNFSLYSAASMKLAHRGFPTSIADLDIPIPPIEKEPEEDSMDIPLPEGDLPSSNDKEENEGILISQDENPISLPSQDGDKEPDDVKSPCSEETEEVRNSDKDTEDDADSSNAIPLEDEDTDKKHTVDRKVDEGNDKEEDEGEDKDAGFPDTEDDQNDNKSETESLQGDSEKRVKSKAIKAKASSDAGEDECSTQGDVLDLAIESEANLENNIPHDDSEEQNEISLAKSPAQLEESDDKACDGGDKSDGLVDITDEEMSVYDGQDNADIEKLNEQIRESIQNDKQVSKSLDSDDDNSLVGGATSAVSAATLNNSDNVQTSTLPGLEGLDTETISESEDVNFDEIPLDGNEQSETVPNEDELNSSRKKKKKKSRKISQTEEVMVKGNNELLEFEEGEIIEEKPKKDKKSKAKLETEVEVDENVDTSKSKVPTVEKEKDTSEKKTKKKKDKSSANKDKTDRNKEKELKEKTMKPGDVDENISWKKLSKSTKERNYRDGKEKDEKDKEKERVAKEESIKKKNKERRKELERYDVRRLISEKPKRPKKDEFGRDISPSKSSTLSPYRPPRYRSPLRARNRSRTRSRSWRSLSRSKQRRRRSRSRGRIRSLDRSKRSRTRDRSRRRSRSRNKVPSRSRERRRSPEKTGRVKPGTRSLSRGRRKARSRSHHSHHSKKRRSYSKSWTPSWSKSSASRSRSPRHRRKSRSIIRSRSWSRERVHSKRRGKAKEPPKNLTVIVSNKEAMKKKEKKKASKKKDDRRKRRRGQSPAPSKEVFTSGDNILVSVNFKNANKNPEIIPATTPLLRESSKRKRDDMVDGSSKKRKSNTSSKKTPGKKSNRLARINAATKNAKPVAIIDLDLSPFREQTPSPREVIVLSDSGDEGDKQRHSEMQDEISRMGHGGINQSMLSLSSIDHGQKNSVSQPESPVSSNFMHNSSGPKTPPEPHIKFSITTKPSQIRMLSNPLMEAEEEMQDENIENDGNEVIHKGPNTPPEPPPEMTTPASPPTTPYDPFDPTKSRSPSPQPRSDTGSQINASREDKLENIQGKDDDHPSLTEPRTSTPPNETEETGKTPEPPKNHSTPKNDINNTTEISPKVSPPTGATESKLAEDVLMQPIKKLLADANKLNVTVHKSPEKLITVVISQQTKNQSQTPKQSVQQIKAITPNKQQTPKSSTKHQLFSSSIVKQVPILGTLLPGLPAYTPSSGFNNSKLSSRSQQNGDTFDDMDIDPSSPYSPGSSEGDDLFEPPVISPPRNSSKPSTNKTKSSGNKFDSLFGSSPAKNRHGRYSSKLAKKSAKLKSKGNKKEEIKVKLDEDQLKILDDLPSSAVEMQVKDKFLKKLNRQERVVEEVKLVLKPHYAKKHVNKEEYKEILRRSVPKICHNKSGEINPIKIQHLIEAYVKKFRYAKKKAAGAIPPLAAQNKPKPQKTLWS